MSKRLSKAKSLCLCFLALALLVLTLCPLGGCMSPSPDYQQQITQYLEQKYPGQTFTVKITATPGLPGDYGKVDAYCYAASEPKALFDFTYDPSDPDIGKSAMEGFPGIYYAYQFNKLIEKAYAKAGVKVSSYLSPGGGKDGKDLPKDLQTYFKEYKPDSYHGEIFLGSDSTKKVDFGALTTRILKELSDEYHIKLEPYIVVIDGGDSYTELISDANKEPVDEVAIYRSDLEGFVTAVLDYRYKNGKANLSAKQINQEIASGHVDKIWNR